MTIEGYLVEPAIIVPENTVDVVVNESGQVFAQIGGPDAA